MVKVKDKVKFSLYLTNYHAMKALPLLNQAPYHKDVALDGGDFSWRGA
jgi:hypothetical protein